MLRIDRALSTRTRFFVCNPTKMSVDLFFLSCFTTALYFFRWEYPSVEPWALVSSWSASTLIPHSFYFYYTSFLHLETQRRIWKKSIYLVDRRYDRSFVQLSICLQRRASSWSRPTEWNAYGENSPLVLDTRPIARRSSEEDRPMDTFVCLRWRYIVDRERGYAIKNNFSAAWKNTVSRLAYLSLKLLSARRRGRFLFVDFQRRLVRTDSGSILITSCVCCVAGSSFLYFHSSFSPLLCLLSRLLDLELARLFLSEHTTFTRRSQGSFFIFFSLFLLQVMICYNTSYHDGWHATLSSNILAVFG